MKKVFSKLLASIITVVMLAVSVGAISASAITSRAVQGSALEYTVFVEKVSGETRQIRVDIHITNNPGVNMLGFILKYDSGCTPLTDKTSFSGDEGTIITSQYDSDTKLVDVIWMNALNDDYSGALDFYFYFNVASTMQQYDFSVGVLNYRSETENINKSLSYNENNIKNDATFSFITSDSKRYMIGDVNSDGAISTDDAYQVVSILGAQNLNAVATYVLNERLNTNDNNLRDKFPAPLFPCAEIADVNRDGLITGEDSTEILQYYSALAVGATPSNTYIGSRHTFTVVYRNTTDTIH